MDKKKEAEKLQNSQNNEKLQQLSGYFPEWYIPGAYDVQIEGVKATAV